MTDPNAPQRPAGHDPRLRETLSDHEIGLDEAPVEEDPDAMLRAGEGVTCYACGQVIRAGDDIRITPKGTRHDTCP